jgi:hypothetical protein
MNFNQSAMLGSGIGVIAGLGSEKSMHVVEIPQGSLHIFSTTPIRSHYLQKVAPDSQKQP